MAEHLAGHPSTCIAAVLWLDSGKFAILFAREASAGDIGKKRVEVEQDYDLVASMLTHNVDTVTVEEFVD